MSTVEHPPATLTRRSLLIGATAAAFTARGAGAAPLPALEGLVRICGSTRMEPLVASWIAGFHRLHPKIDFAVDLKGTATAQFGLHLNTADIAVSARQIYPYEYYGIYRRSQLLTREVPVAIGSANRPGLSTAIGVFVHRDNPLRGLSVEQLDGIFGAARTGGWQGMEWATDVARMADRDIRYWRQLNVSGAWADQPINPYGPPGVHPGGVSYFQSRVMGGADTWNDRLREFPDREAMLAAIARDRFGIGYAALGHKAEGVRALPLSEATGGRLIAPSPAAVATFSYPLSRLAYFYLAPDSASGDPAPVAPHIRAFVDFVLSAPGQRTVAPATGYFPLTPTLATRARAALASER